MTLIEVVEGRLHDTAAKGDRSETGGAFADALKPGRLRAGAGRVHGPVRKIIQKYGRANG